MSTADRRRVSGDPDLWAYDGRALLGYLFSRPAGIVATLPDRLALGTFKDWKEGGQAISEACRRQKPEAA